MASDHLNKGKSARLAQPLLCAAFGLIIASCGGATEELASEGSSTTANSTSSSDAPDPNTLTSDTSANSTETPNDNSDTNAASSSSTPNQSPTDERPNPSNGTQATNPLANATTARLVEDGYKFTEGPAWLGDKLFFSDIPNNTIHQLNADGTVTAFKEPQDSNGIISDDQGNLLVATHGGAAVARISLSGDSTTLADNYNGQKFNSPNDLVLHSNGDIFFTDPPYALGERTSEIGCSGVYKLAPNREVTQLACYPLEVRPNGIALSPDETKLYVAFTVSGEVKSWDLDSNGATSNETVVATTAGNADGMVVDADGNLFVTSVAGVEVYAPDGSKWGTITAAEQPANVTLGGPNNKTVYITARKGLYAAEL